MNILIILCHVELTTTVYAFISNIPQIYHSVSTSNIGYVPNILLIKLLSIIDLSITHSNLLSLDKQI